MSRERVSWIDALRGFSMLGIMVVNLPSMNTLAGNEGREYGFIRTTADQVVGQFSMMLLNGKCYPIFAFLFGIGMFVFMNSREEKGLNPYQYMMRRLSVLFVFGALHTVLIWWGDILLIYSVLGMILIPFYAVRAQKIMVASLSLLLGVPVLFTVVRLLDFHPTFSTFSTFDFSIFPQILDWSAVHSVYAQGSFWEVSQQRVLDSARDFFPFLVDGADFQTWLGSLAYYSQLMGLFLLGTWTGKTRFYQSVKNHLQKLRWIFWFCLALSVLTSSLLSLGGPVRVLHGSALSACYVCLFILSYQSRVGRAVLNFFVPVGRMSLTSYLAHTGTFSLLLYGYGWGWYGHVGPGFLLSISLAFYASVTLICHLWLRVLPQGPMEWIWRKAVEYTPFTPASRILLNREGEIASPILRVDRS